MKSNPEKRYKISGNHVTHLKLTKISLPENETLSMYKRYRFDSESTQKMIEEAQRMHEEYNMRQEQKEYEEMNYSAIYRRLSSKYSTWELIKQLLGFM